MAHRVLGARALAVTADSESLSATSGPGAGAGGALRLRAPDGRDGGRSTTRSTPATRRPLLPLQDRPLPPPGPRRPRRFAHVAYGLIVDDLSDYRPGQRAAEEAARAPRSPRRVRQGGRARSLAAARLPTAELPASPCLASRLPYGTPVTKEALARVDAPSRRCGRSASASCACATWAIGPASRSRPRSCLAWRRTPPCARPSCARSARPGTRRSRSTLRATAAGG